MNSARSRPVLDVGVTLLLAWIAPAFARAPGDGGPAGSVTVAVATAEKGDLTLRIPALGTVTPLTTVTVKSRLSGQLLATGFTEGQLVHPGDFLAQIDPRPYQAALSQAEGNLRRDQGLLTKARMELARPKQGGTEAAEVDNQTATVEQYAGAVASDEAAVAAAKLNVEYTRIVAPVAGRVGLRLVDPGNYVTAADANGIVLITQLQPITAIFTLPEDNIIQISRRLAAGAILPVTALDRSNRNQLATGRLLALDNQIDTNTGTVKVRALFDNKDGALFPNAFINVQLTLDTLHDQLLVPVEAVRRGAPNGIVTSFVYLVNRLDSTVSVRAVEVGPSDDAHIAITQGLSAGDTVVTRGGDRLHDGTKVLLSGGPAPHGPVAR